MVANNWMPKFAMDVDLLEKQTKQEGMIDQLAEKTGDGVQKVFRIGSLSDD